MKVFGCVVWGVPSTLTKKTQKSKQTKPSWIKDGDAVIHVHTCKSSHTSLYASVISVCIWDCVLLDTPKGSHFKSSLGRHSCVPFKQVGTYSKQACKLNQAHPIDNQSTLNQNMIFRGTKENYNNLIWDTEFVSKLPSIQSFTSSVFVNLTVSIKIERTVKMP